MRDHGGSEWALLQLANTAPRPSRSGTRPPPQRDRSWCLSYVASSRAIELTRPGTTRHSSVRQAAPRSVLGSHGRALGETGQTTWPPMRLRSRVGAVRRRHHLGAIQRFCVDARASRPPSLPQFVPRYPCVLAYYFVLP